jgi:hypothetical protein
MDVENLKVVRQIGLSILRLYKVGFERFFFRRLILTLFLAGTRRVTQYRRTSRSS